jgi:hypothetical protein
MAKKRKVVKTKRQDKRLTNAPHSEINYLAAGPITGIGLALTRDSDKKRGAARKKRIEARDAHRAANPSASRDRAKATQKKTKNTGSGHMNNGED